jgi:DEAD/DEAH box helicase
VQAHELQFVSGLFDLAPVSSHFAVSHTRRSEALEKMSEEQLSAEERKRRRLEAWRRKQQQQQQQQQQQPPPLPPPPLPDGFQPPFLPPPPPPPPPPPLPPAPPKAKVKLSLGKKLGSANVSSSRMSGGAPSTKRTTTTTNPFGSTSDDEEEEADQENDSLGWRGGSRRRRLPLDLMEEENDGEGMKNKEDDPEPQKKKRKRWDTKAGASSSNDPTVTQPHPRSSNDNDNNNNDGGVDALDQFMDQLQSSELPKIVTAELSIQVSGTMTKSSAWSSVSAAAAAPSPTTTTTRSSAGGSADPKLHPWATASAAGSGGVITAEQLFDNHVTYTPSDWMSDNEDEEGEERARRAMIEALKAATVPTPTLQSSDRSSAEEEGNENDDAEELHRPAQLAAEVKSEKHRREEQMRELERQAEEARILAERASAPELGRLFDDAESGVMEEAERNLAAAQAAPDALQVLAELNKKKELGAVDHSKIEYLPFTKNLYRVPRALAALSNDEVVDRRAKLKVRVRGHGAPAPVSTFEECGLSEKILKILANQGIQTPFPIQAQCIPCIMAGRDVIGIAKTGSGKTLAYLLPLLRHILAQPPLQPNESGPIGLILAPARELAYQIHIVCKGFAKQLGLK